jgi:hypothetical protein
MTGNSADTALSHLDKDMAGDCYSLRRAPSISLVRNHWQN